MRTAGRWCRLLEKRQSVTFFVRKREREREKVCLRPASCVGVVGGGGAASREDDEQSECVRSR